MTEHGRYLSLNTEWALGEEKYNSILQSLSGRRVRRILEFGSGRSTVRLATDFSEASVQSVEHDESILRRTREMLAEHGVSNADLKLCPLRWVRWGMRWYRSYDLDPKQVNCDLDFVLIDGPVESETLRGREAPLYAIFDRIAEGGVIVLDDYHRPSARAVVRNWLASFGRNLALVSDGSTGDYALLEKRGEQFGPRFPGTIALADNISATLALLARDVKRRVRRLIRSK